MIALFPFGKLKKKINECEFAPVLPGGGFISGLAEIILIRVLDRNTGTKK
jgi:hypothetical protein